MIQLTDSNFLLYASKNYDDCHGSDVDEFYEDLNRFKYLKRLFSRYKETNELKERLILNHLIILYNLFGVEATTRMLFFKIKEYPIYLKTFLMFLNYMPEMIYGIDGEDINSKDIPIDIYIAKKLREL